MTALITVLIAAALTGSGLHVIGVVTDGRRILGGKS